MTLFFRWTFQDVHRPFSIEISGEQASVGGEIFWWLLLFRELEFEVIVNPVRLNLGPKNLLRLESGEELVNLDDSIPDAQLFAIMMFDGHYRDIIHFFITRYGPEGLNTA